MNSAEIKYFTVKEAKTTLPLVKQIVKDILDTGFIIKSIAEIIEGNIDENEEIKLLLAKMNSFFLELEEIGCYYKDWNFSAGTVDFPSKIDGEDVFLCWQSGEEDILYYHDVTSGFSGRKQIPPEYL